MANSDATSTFNGRVAIVTGGGSRGDGIGNGRAAATLLARAGARVAVVDRDGSAANRTAEMIHAEGGAAIVIEADVTVEADCKAVVAQTVDRWGRVDMLDNNVGVERSGSVLDVTIEDWEDSMRTNLQSVVAMSRATIPMLAEQGGAIVNTASTAALQPRGQTAFSTAMGAIMSLTRAMALDHAAAKIRVNCVAPGPVFTPASESISAEEREQRRLASPLGVEGTGWDVGNAVAFLLSDDARWITGQTLIVDGGVSLTTAPH